MVLQPLSALNLSDGLEAPAHRVLADDLLHAQQLGEHAIAAKRRDVGIAFMPRQNREHCRAEHIALLRRVGARISERAIGHERVEQARHLEILDEEWQLPVGRQRRCGIPSTAPVQPRCQELLAPMQRLAQSAVVHPQGEPEGGADRGSCA